MSCLHESSRALPDLSSLAGLKVEYLPPHLQAWEDGGRKSFSAHQVPARARVRLTGLQPKFAHLNGRGGTVARVDLAQLMYTVTLDEAMENGKRNVRFPEGNLEPEAA